MAPRSIAELLAEIPWLRSLSANAQDRVLADTYETFHRKGNLLVRFGDPSRSWIYVADGLLKVSARDRGGRSIMFTVVSRGGWVGEGSVIKREPRRYDISALHDTRVLHVPAATVQWLLDSSIEFSQAMMVQLNERLSQYISMVEIDRMQDPVARVARTLAVLFNPVLYPHMTAAVPLSQQELGELAGLSRQSISLALKQLQANNHVAMEYNVVFVKDVQALSLYHDSTRPRGIASCAGGRHGAQTAPREARGP